MPEIQIKFTTVIWFSLFLLLGDIETTLSSLIAALLHELGHITVMYLRKMPPRRIIIHPVGAEIIPSPGITSHFTDTVIFLSGCAVNFICAAAAFQHFPIFAQASLTLGLFNLLPICGLDGERTLFSLLSLFFEERICLKICTAISNISLFFAWIIGVYIFFFTAFNSTLFMMCVFLFVAATAQGNRVYR